MLNCIPYLHVLVDVGRGLGPVTAELAGEGLAVRVPVLDVAVEVGLVGAGHLALGALVVVDVRAHVVAEVAEEREHLLTVRAAVRHLRDRRLPLAVVVELGSVGEQTPAPAMGHVIYRVILVVSDWVMLTQFRLRITSK